MSPLYNTRPYKGKSLMFLPKDYTVIDLETTGMDSRHDNIIEIGAIKVKDRAIIDRFQRFVKLDRAYSGYTRLPAFIVSLTGIHDEDLENGREPAEALKDLLEFLEDDLIVGHNVNFDINFLYDACSHYLDRTVPNDFVDTLRLSRKLLPHLEHHNLHVIAEYLGTPPEISHRAVDDCETTHNCLVRMVQTAVEKYGSEEAFEDLSRPRRSSRKEKNESFGTVYVLSGPLSKMSEDEVSEALKKRGGVLRKTLTSGCDVLVLAGDLKIRLPEEALVLNHHALRIINEQDFYDLLDHD